MNYLVPLFSLHWGIIRNTYWRTRWQKITTILLLGVGVGAAVGFAYLIKRHFLEFLDPAWLLDPALGWIAFGLILAFIFFATLTESMTNLIPRFYRSPDLNYLLALPIPANQVLAIKFLAAQLQSSLGVLFLGLSMLIAAGWSIGAAWFYYAALLPIFWVFTLIPAGFGLLIGMALLRVMTARTFGRFAGVLSIGTSILWFAYFGRISAERLMEMISRGMELFGWLRHIPTDLLSLVSTSRLLSALAIGEPIPGLRSLFMLLMVTGVSLLFIFWLARRLFLQGWLMTQSTPASQPRKTSAAAVGREAKVPAPWIAAVQNEWRRALRNEEMRFISLITLAGFSTIVFLLIEGRMLTWLGGSTAAGLVVIIIAACVLLPIGMVMLFIPLDQLAKAGSGKGAEKLFKQSLWLTKVLPLSTHEVLLINLVKIVVAPFLLGMAGVVIYSLLAGVTFFHTLLAIIGLKLLLLGFIMSNNGLEIWVSTGTAKANPLIANLVQTFIPVVYLGAAGGPLTRYLFSDVFRMDPLGWHPFLIGGLISWSVVSLLAIWGGWKLAARCWEEMEID